MTIFDSLEGKPSGNVSKLRKMLLKWLQTYHVWSSAKYIFLVILVIGYAFVGAGIFYAIEKPAQEDRLVAARKESLIRRRAVVDSLVNLAWTCYNGTDNAEDCRNATLSVIRSYDQANSVDNSPKMWNFWNAFYYASTLYTTIGFGNVYCSTRLGQGITILYAIIGIPFMLTALKYIGQALFARSSFVWRLVRRKIRNLYRLYKENSPHRKKLSFVERRDSVLEIEDDDLEAVFPVPLAIFIICAYMLIVAGLIAWRNPDWDYFTSFYYFFISLSTIGLGDKIALPENHNYMLSFIYTLIGLALLSMCINVMQNRVERGYSRALQNMEILLQLTQEVYDDDEESVAAATVEHPDWALFRASQALSTLNMKRIGSIAYPYALGTAAAGISKTDLRRNSRIVLDHLYNKNPHQMRQSIVAMHRLRPSMRSDDKNSTGFRHSILYDNLHPESGEGRGKEKGVRFCDDVKEEDDNGEGNGREAAPGELQKY